MKTSDPSNKPDVDFDRCKAAPWKRKAGQDRFAERRRARHEEIDSSPNGKLLSGPVTFNLAAEDSDEAEADFFPGKPEDQGDKSYAVSVAVQDEVATKESQTNTTASLAATIQWQ